MTAQQTGPPGVENAAASFADPAAITRITPGRLGAAPLVRAAAITAWVAAFAYRLVTAGFPFDPPLVLAWTITGVAVISIGRRSAWLVVLDFLPVAVVLLVWVYLRGAAVSFGRPALWTPQISFDKAIFAGAEPTVWLQAHLKSPTPRWWSVPITACYLSFFVAPWLLAGVLWLRRRADYYRWIGQYIALSFVGFGCFALFPAAPPWAAARCTAVQIARGPSNPACMYRGGAGANGGLLGRFTPTHAGAHPYVERISTSGLAEVHMHVAQRLVANGADAADLVAGVPSLHAGATMLIALFMWRRVRGGWRCVLVSYPLFMAFTLVYTGEHYVFDVIAGWVAALAVTVGAGWLERRLEPAMPRRLRPRHGPTLTGSARHRADAIANPSIRRSCPRAAGGASRPVNRSRSPDCAAPSG